MRRDPWVGWVALSILALIVGSGLALQSPMWRAAHPSSQSDKGPALTPAELTAILGATLAAAGRLGTDEPLTAITLHMKNGYPIGELQLAGSHGRIQSFDARTGELIAAGPPTAAEPNPESLLSRLRREDTPGESAPWLTLGFALSFVLLGLTGLIFYTHYYRQRIKRWRRQVFW